MSEIRLLVILRRLDDIEFKKLGEMVQSPFFTKNKKCKQLYDLLTPFYPDFKDEKLTKDWIFANLFPEKGKTTSSLSTTMSILQSLIEELLVYQALNDRFLYKKHLLLKQHLSKGLHRLYQSQYEETMTRFSKMKKRDSMNFLEQYLLESENYKFNRTNKGRDKIFDPTTLSEHLDSYFWIQKLNIACETKAYRSIFPPRPEKEYELLQLSQEGDYDLLELNKNFPQATLSVLFRYMLRCIQQPENEVLFNEFLILFLSVDPKAVDKIEYNELFIHSINYCIIKIREGKEAYRKKLFELYKLVVDFELIYENGYLNLNRVKNIISCSIQVGELEWADEFLEVYKTEIHPEQFNNAYHFYKASIYFYSKEYNEAIANLNKIETDIDKYFFLDRTTLLLRSFYEGNSPLAFDNTCKSFRSNIKRNKKLTPVDRDSYKNFARIANFLHQYKNGFGKKTKAKLLEMIEEAEVVSHKRWLMEKWGELK